MQSGKVELDGHDLTTLNCKWLRSKMAMVGQEPKLFSGSIRENIAHGLPGAYEALSEEELQAKVEEAAKSANAHEFILNFPKQYDTEVGQSQSQIE